MPANDLPTLFFANQHEWETWLEENLNQEQGVWLKFAKKKSGATSVTYDEALDVALCFGWIDGQAASFDEQFYLQKFTPRRAKSIWSKRNAERAEELILAGKMRPSGLSAIESAKRDGRWERAYDSPSSITVPADFQVALDADPLAKEFFATLNSANRYAILWRIQTVAKPETRQARIERLVEMLHEGRKFHP